MCLSVSVCLCLVHVVSCLLCVVVCCCVFFVVGREVLRVVYLCFVCKGCGVSVEGVCVCARRVRVSNCPNELLAQHRLLFGCSAARPKSKRTQARSSGCTSKSVLHPLMEGLTRDDPLAGAPVFHYFL